MEGWREGEGGGVLRNTFPPFFLCIIFFFSPFSRSEKCVQREATESFSDAMKTFVSSNPVKSSICNTHTVRREEGWVRRGGEEGRGEKWRRE